MVVDNRPGGGGLIGADAVAKAPADGYTLLLGSTALAITPALYSKLPYDPRKDLKPVSAVAKSGNVLLGRQNGFNLESLHVILFPHWRNKGNKRIKGGLISLFSLISLPRDWHLLRRLTRPCTRLAPFALVKPERHLCESRVASDLNSC